MQKTRKVSKYQNICAAADWIARAAGAACTMHASRDHSAAAGPPALCPRFVRGLHLADAGTGAGSSQNARWYACETPTEKR